ncbi:MAG: 3-dehydroquinate synthase II [Desulfobacteraceae bacterium]|nr:MAG: 3-dehydroquinate synthase II [Desulfobacteraceae bacterium]
MRRIWVRADPWDKEIVTTALEGGADGIVVPKGYSERVKELGKILTISEDGDLKTGEDVVFFTMTSGKDEDEILRLCANRKVILQCGDWTVIPLENLIAKGADVIAQVHSYEEACTVFGILEKGVRHILFYSDDIAQLKKTLSIVNSESEKVKLQEAEIVEVTPAGMGDRVCVDTCTSMVQGQGLLVGNSSSALFLVHAETVENPYVSPRPFRVNAGAVHAYTRVPGGKTRYLSELAAGDRILITDYRGNMTGGIIGRLKIEKRPLMLVKAAAGERQITTILQNAETIRLTSPDGTPVSVVSLKKGDKILIAAEESGRHFGHKIDESITEK